MKTFYSLLTVLLLSSWSFAEDIEWTHAYEAGEDATSTHYYFFLSNGESVERIRWVWNGGAQNAPTVTEYILSGSSIKIRRLTGDRKSLKATIAGKDTEDLKLEEEYVIASKDSAHTLVPPPPDKTLTDQQRIDLSNLISLLAHERVPVKK